MARPEGPRCPSCHRVLTQPARYCDACGTWLTTMSNDAVLAPPPVPAGSSPPCPRCAYPTVVHGNFCANCGYRLNQAPLTRAEAKTRRWQAEQAAKPVRSQAQRDRSTVRSGWIAIVVCSLLLVADIAFLVDDPAHATFLGPIAALLVLHSPVWLSAFNDARKRRRHRTEGPPPPTGEAATPATAPPPSSATGGR